MATLADRFESKVDRSGEHHLWLGAKKADGTGLLKVNCTMTTAPRVAWELSHGPLPEGLTVRRCSTDKACVRLDHLSLAGKVREAARPKRTSTRRGPRGGGHKEMLRPGVWRLTVAAGRYADCRRRREHETVYVDTEEDANRELARFVAEVHGAGLPENQADRDIVVDDAIERYLTEYLEQEKGREANTIRVYRAVHRTWFSPTIGKRRVCDIDEAVIDRIFGKMRAAGLSASRLADARNLYSPFFRWAKRRKIVRRSPMVDFEMPTSTYVARKRVPPEADQLCRYLKPLWR